jgi:hypothetical protein
MVPHRPFYCSGLTIRNSRRKKERNMVRKYYRPKSVKGRVGFFALLSTTHISGSA